MVQNGAVRRTVAAGEAGEPIVRGKLHQAFGANPKAEGIAQGQVGHQRQHNGKHAGAARAHQPRGIFARGKALALHSAYFFYRMAAVEVHGEHGEEHL